MEKLLLTLLAFAEKLDVVDDEDIDAPMLILEIGQPALFNRADKTVDELFAAQKADGQIAVVFAGGMADGMKKMSFAQSHAAVQKEGVVNCAGILTDGNAAGMCQAIAGTDDEIVKRIIGMQTQTVQRSREGAGFGGDGACRMKTDGNKEAGDFLRGFGKNGQAMVIQVVDFSLVRAADVEMAAAEGQCSQVAEPGTDINRVRRTDFFKNLLQNLCRFLLFHFFFLRIRGRRYS